MMLREASSKDLPYRLRQLNLYFLGYWFSGTKRTVCLKQEEKISTMGSYDYKPTES